MSEISRAWIAAVLGRFHAKALTEPSAWEGASEELYAAFERDREADRAAIRDAKEQIRPEHPWHVRNAAAIQRAQDARAGEGT